MAGGLSYAHISFLTFQATVQVIFICITGFVCARAGLLSPQAQKYISLLNVNLFTPALVFSKLAPSLSLKKILEISIIPIFYALSTGVSVLCSRFMSQILRLNEPESNYVTAMSVFGNSNSLPVSLTVALAYTLPNLYWDILDDDTPDKVASRGILYLLIFQQLGQVLRWSWGYNTLLKKRSAHELEYDPYSKNVDSEQSSGLFRDDQEELEQLSDGQNGQNSTPDENNYGSEGVSLPETEILEFFPRQSWGQFFKALLKSFLSFMNPPLYAMALSVIVASIPLLQNTFFVDGGFIQNTIGSAIRDLGSVSIPLILVVLGSNLYPSEETPAASRNYKKIIIGSLVSRMILPPLILLPIIALCVKYIQISILDDPIFLIVAFILTISPPAIQLSQICQLNELYEQEMAGILFWGYVVLTLPSTIFVVVTSLEVLDWADKLMK